MHEQAKKILVIDDEVKTLEVVRALLKSKGYTVFTAENANQAYKIFDNESKSQKIYTIS
jgi:DNA-binding NtrC family response regulator